MLSNLDIIMFRSSLILSMGKIRLSQEPNVAKKAFTLAELLVVLVVVGVIGGIAIPAVYQNIQDAQNKTQWKATYSMFAQAVRELATDNGGDLAGTFTNADVFRDKILAYMNYVKKCDAGTPVGSNGCWSDITYKLSGENYSFISWTRAALNNGVLMTSYIASSSCASNLSGRGNTCSFVGFDVNGFQGPNKIGKDIFALWVLRDGNILPTGSKGDFCYNNPASYSCDVVTYSTNNEGWSCSTDYLKR
ncbi:MAG: prepilin-type N-terminal cleavage/methylation domain-containing protein [bacterium]